MIPYRAGLDVPAATLSTIARWLTTHRRRPGTRPAQRTASARTQALLVLRWFKDATKLRLLALDAGIGIATAYRYQHEAIDVIAAHAPALRRVTLEPWRLTAITAAALVLPDLDRPATP